MKNLFKYKTTLLVDDVDLDNFVSKTIIQAYKFAETVYVQNSGNSAIQFLKSLTSNDKAVFPEVIFIDINMPAMDGFQFMEVLKTELNTELTLHNPKLVMLTSSVFNSDRQKAKQSFDDIIFMVKPLTEEMLRTL